jgi:hypothetical protein
MHSDFSARVRDSADWGECPRSHVIHVQAVACLVFDAKLWGVALSLLGSAGLTIPSS